MGELAEAAETNADTAPITLVQPPAALVMPVPNKSASREKDAAMLGGFGFGAVLRALAQERLVVWCEPFLGLSKSTGKAGSDIKEPVASAWALGSKHVPSSNRWRGP